MTESISPTNVHPLFFSQKTQEKNISTCAIGKKIKEISYDWLLNNQKTVLASVSTGAAMKLVYNVCAQEGNGLQCIFWQKLLCHAAMLASVSILMWVIKNDIPRKQ